MRQLFVKEHRLDKGYKYAKQLYEKINMSKYTYEKIENSASSNHDYEDLLSICKGLGITLKELEHHPEKKFIDPERSLKMLCDKLLYDNEQLTNKLNQFKAEVYDKIVAIDTKTKEYLDKL